jgi:protein-disulfide isomerase
VRKRIVETGLARFRFLDFPLPQHQNSLNAHLAAACANDQGKFWEMHDRLFLEQDKWNGQATRNPKRIFASYVEDIGIDEDMWSECYDGRRHVPMIQASVEQGSKRQVRGTPTFIIGDKMINEVLSYDAIKRLVDSATVAQNKSLQPVPPADRP